MRCVNRYDQYSTYTVDGTGVGVSSMDVGRTERMRAAAVFRHVTKTLRRPALRVRRLHLNSCTDNEESVPNTGPSRELMTVEAEKWNIF